MELGSEPTTAVDEFLQTDRHPHENNVRGNGERLEKIQDGAMEMEMESEGGALQENPDSAATAQTQENSIIEPTEEKRAMLSSSTSGMKRKAETSERTSEEEAASLAPSGEESQQKWYCSLCGVSTTSEGTLNHHMRGKKHKAKEAKLKSNDSPKVISMNCDSSDNALKLAGPSNGMSRDGERTPVTSKWHCSLCQVSATSEALLNAHFQGKKHKSKEVRLGLGQSTGNKDGIENVKTEAMTKWYCSVCQVYAASENNLQEHFQGKKHKAKEAGQTPTPENEQEKTDNRIPESGKNSENEQEMKETSRENGGGGDKKRRMNGETGKYWHCETCNEGTQDEASMNAHRKSDKHRKALREKCGGVIVVSRIMVKEAVEGGKVAEE